MPRGTKAGARRSQTPACMWFTVAYYRLPRRPPLSLRVCLSRDFLGAVSIVLLALGPLLLLPFLPRRGKPLLRLTLGFLTFVACKGARGLFHPALGFLPIIGLLTVAGPSLYM